MTMLFQKGEDMATNILLVNQKGGVGKTTFADEIAWGLERRGHKVGFGNLDPQGGANQAVGRQFLELLEADDLPVLGTVPTAAAFKQGAALGKPVYEIAKSGKAAQAIESILDEIEEVL